jgi:GT2 family glycosyltransferase
VAQRAVTSPALTPGLTVSVVTYHSPLDQLQRTLLCLCRALRQLRTQGDTQPIELRIWDNSESPAYHTALRQLLDAVIPATELSLRLSAGAANLGFGAGHNANLIGLATSQLLLLNPDAELDEDALRACCNYMAGLNEVALLGPNGRDSDAQPLYLCKDYPSVAVLALRAAAPRWLRKAFDRLLARYECRHLIAADEPTTVTMVSGACMLLCSEAWLAVGGFDPDYFLYFEDFDLSLRIARHGRVQYHPSLRICHHGGYAARKGWQHRQLFLRSGWRFFQRHGWRWF